MGGPQVVLAKVEDGRVNPEDLVVSPPAVEDVPLENLHPELRRRWLVEVDVAKLTANKDLEGLSRAVSSQEQLAAQYRELQTYGSEDSAGEKAPLHWKNLLVVIGKSLL